MHEVNVKTAIASLSSVSTHPRRGMLVIIIAFVVLSPFNRAPYLEHVS